MSPARPTPASHTPPATATQVPGWLSGLRSWFDHPLGHLGVAVAVACTVGVLHHQGVLGWLDAPMLRLTGAAVASRASPLPEAAMPEVVLIGEGLYQNRFGASSPLNRSEMAQLLQRLFRLSAQPGEAPDVPITLVVDIDLSDNANADRAQETLDAVLADLVKRGTRLVLPMPLPSGLREQQLAKMSWMKRMCALGGAARSNELSSQVPAPSMVRLASAELHTQAGQVLQYAPNLLTLGVAAARPNVGMDGCALGERARAMHVDPLTLPHVPPLALTYDPDHAPKPRFEPFNAGFFAGLRRHTHVIPADGALSDAAGSTPRFKGKVVFLGGSYDPRDRFDSPWVADNQPVPGAALHAAVYASVKKPIKELSWLSWLIDVAVGFVAGNVFHKLWHKHRLAGVLRGAAGYFVPKALTVGIVLTAFAAAVFLVWAAGRFFYPLNLWVNPGPVILGVCLKVVLSSSVVHHRHHTLVVRRTLQVLLALLVGVFLYVSLSH